MIVIGLLRFVGLLNAAVWFGTVASFLLVYEPAATSGAMRELLGQKSFPYFSAAVCQLIAARSFALFLICALVAMLHMGAEWLYFGKYPRRIWLTLVFTLFLGGLAQSYGLQQKLAARLLVEHSPKSTPQQREEAADSYRAWHLLSEALNLVLLGGLGIYLWHVANPPDEMRFVGATHLPGKFRS